MNFALFVYQKSQENFTPGLFEVESLLPQLPKKSNF